MGSTKGIYLKNCTYYFFDDMINKRSYKNIDIYHIGYITMKDFNYINIV